MPDQPNNAPEVPDDAREDATAATVLSEDLTGSPTPTDEAEAHPS